MKDQSKRTRKRNACLHFLALEQIFPIVTVLQHLNNERDVKMKENKIISQNDRG